MCECGREIELEGEGEKKGWKKRDVIMQSFYTMHVSIDCLLAK